LHALSGKWLSTFAPQARAPANIDVLGTNSPERAGYAHPAADRRGKYVDAAIQMRSFGQLQLYLLTAL
jgi:hypothetical protein